MPSTYASRRPSILYGLIWKEAMQLLPLLFALVAMSTLLFVVLRLIPNGSRAFPTFLILIPNIFALGAPPMSIGQEDETGTLRWMRGLPVDWRWILLVKTTVALVGLALIWLFLIALAGLIIPREVFGGGEVFSVEAIGGIGFALAFSLYLMSGGFLISWWLRAPIASLLTMLPLITVLFVVILQIATRMAGPQHSSAIAHALWLCGTAVVLMAIATFAARRTLCRPLVRRRGRRSVAVDSAIRNAYQPVSIVPLHSPGPRFALLWQAFAQTWLVVLPLFCVGFISAMVAVAASLIEQQRQMPEFAIAIALLVTSFLGAMVFVTDNKNRRHRFLADRGIGPFTVWWTRQAVPLLAALVIAGMFLVFFLTPASAPQEGGLTASRTLLLFASAFACGQLTGQAFRRPVVGMLAAPVALVATVALAISVLTLYPSYVWAGIGAVVFLWLVTLRLCRRWSEERMNAGYYGRLGGWIGLAALALVGTIAAVRFATTPPASPDWHEQTLVLAKRTVAVDGVGSHLLDVDPATRPGSPPGERRYAISELRETAEKVVEDERMVLGHHARADAPRILETLRTQVPENRSSDPGDPSDTAYEKWLRAMLLSSRRTYETAGGGWNQLRVGEGLEAVAVYELLRPDSRELLGESAWAQLVSLVPNSAERVRWRKNYLLRGWLSYYRDPRYVPFIPLAGGSSPAEMRRLIPAEQWRTGRFLDRAVRISLSQLGEGIPPAGSLEEARRLKAWQALMDDEFAGFELFYGGRFGLERTPPTSEWSKGVEQSAERLRAKAESVAGVY